MGTAWYDTVATLGWLAGDHRAQPPAQPRLRAAYRHPLVTAKAFATLDELSGGRAILGVGAGHVEAEFDLLGVHVRRAGPLTDEAIDGIRAAFADEFGGHDGGFGQRPGPASPAGRRSGWAAPRRPPCAGRRAGRRLAAAGHDEGRDGRRRRPPPRATGPPPAATARSPSAPSCARSTWATPGTGTWAGHARRRRRPHPPRGRRLRGAWASTRCRSGSEPRRATSTSSRSSASPRRSWA